MVFILFLYQILTRCSEGGSPREAHLKLSQGILGTVLKNKSVWRWFSLQTRTFQVSFRCCLNGVVNYDDHVNLVFLVT